MITDLNKKVKKITVDGITMELKPKVLGGEYNLESVLLEGGTQKIVATKAGVVTSGKYFVKVIDYDGTILKEINASTGDIITLPNAPSHDGLIFQEWSCSQEIVDNTITITDNNVMVGATYTTASGLNEFDIELTKVTGLEVKFRMVGTKDWGDGTSDDLNSHTYANYGNYTIKCNGTSVPSNGSNGVFYQDVASNNYYCVSVRLTSGTTIAKHAFRDCRSLKNVIIPKGLTIINEYAFYDNYSLKSIIIPNGVSSIGRLSFQYCSSLTNIVLPKSLTSIGSDNVFANCPSLVNLTLPESLTDISGYTFQYCYSLTHIIIPNGVTSIRTSIFQYCYSLTSITIPAGVTSISSNAFNQCRSLKLYDFSKLTTIPTLENINAFYNINKIAKIIVPDELYDEWVATTNWVTYADYIYKASEVNV